MGSYKPLSRPLSGIANKTFLDYCSNAFDPVQRISTLTLLLAALLDEETLAVQLVAHPLMAQLTASLMLDTSNYLFPIGLRTLFTILPFTPTAMTERVPYLMVILGRAVCWRDRPFTEEPRSGYTSTYPPADDWDVLTSVNDSHITALELQPDHVVRLLLVAIYGAWPSNVIAFVRDPVAYLNLKFIQPVYNTPWSEIWEPGLLAARTGPLLRNFQLHPSLISHTSAAELADSKRWEKIDPSEYIARANVFAQGDMNDRFDFMSSTSVAAERRLDTVSQYLSADVLHLQRENNILRLEALASERVRKQYLFREYCAASLIQTSHGYTRHLFSCTATKQRSRAL
jgi:hypothetical protein